MASGSSTRPHQSEAKVQVPKPTVDTTIEPDETVILTLASGTGYTIGTTTPVTGTITNDDLPSVTLSVSPAMTATGMRLSVWLTLARSSPGWLTAPSSMNSRRAMVVCLAQPW